MSSSTIGISHLRKAALKKQLADLYPEHSALFADYWRKPGCSSCWRKLLNALASDTSRLKAYFGDVEIEIGDVPAMHSEARAASYAVSCHVNEIHHELSELFARYPVGHKSLSICRFEQDVTMIVVVSDFDSGQTGHRSFTCHINELQDKLDDLDASSDCAKMISSCRWKEEVTIIAILSGCR